MNLDREAHRLYLRVAYAGPPLSGKTQTLRALLQGLRGVGDEAISSPADARGGHWFDWAEHVGGLFQGERLHCQIVTVPGDDALRERRRALLEDADVVVFVIDGRREQLAAGKRSLAELRPWLARPGLPPVEIVYQQNKVDLADAADVAAVRRALEVDEQAEIHRASALRGEGVRFGFVAAARACVRRADALVERHALRLGKVEVATAEQLVARLRDAAGAAVVTAPPAPPPRPPAPPPPAPPIVVVAPPPPLPPPPPPVAMTPRMTPPPMRLTPPAMPPPQAYAPVVLLGAPRAPLVSVPSAKMPAPLPAPLPLPPPPPPPPPVVMAAPVVQQASLPAPAPVRVPEPVVAPAPGVQARPAIMPMADWLAQQPKTAAPARRAREKTAVPALMPAPKRPQAAPVILAMVPDVVPVPPPPPPLPSPLPLPAHPALTARPVEAPRPAVMPMSAWRAQQARIEAQPPVEPETEPAPADTVVAAAPPILTIVRATPAARPAVLPMAAWLAGLAPSEWPRRHGAPRLPAETLVDTVTVAPIVAPEPEPQEEQEPDGLADARAAFLGVLLARPATEAVPEAEAEADAFESVTPVYADENGPDEPAMPWLPGNRWSLIELWPPGIWPTVMAAAHGDVPRADRHGRGDIAVGSGWYARSEPLAGSADEARLDFDRLVQWQMSLGDTVSTSRCAVLCGAGPDRWCTSQLIQRTPTLDSLVVAAFDPGVSAKRVIYLLARAAASYMAAASEFARRQVHLPVHLSTVTRVDRHTVYADFLPPEPVEDTGEPAIARLEVEMRAQMRRDRLAIINVPDVLRELEILMESKPQLAETLEMLQLLLIGG